MKLSPIAKVVALGGAILGIGVAVGVLTGIVAWGHAELVESNIKNGQVFALGDAPTQVQLTFSEHLNAQRSAIYVVLLGPNTLADQGDLTVKEEQMTISLQERKPGIYQIRWIAVAEEDAGVSEGTITFSIKE
uniref:Copper resistance protein CopC n=2 Tax=Candidatus Bipolaricaulota TaxID=67810 RepID=H5SA13_9BACT|nr:copper resistance protein CopC [uncultured Acetothermia bacterium]BAL60171.1 copper resistance protein CopC [Candidatus Acetothermum autotrophicum]